MTDSPRVVWNPNFAMLKALADAHDGRWILDCETDGLQVRRPMAKSRVHYVGATPLGKNFCLVWDRDHWTPAISNFLAGERLIGHNLRFDLHALNMVPTQPWEDTMNMKYFHNTPGRKSLDDCCAAIGLPKIATPAAITAGRIAEMDPNEVAAYLADDCVKTGLVYLALIGQYSAHAPDWEWRLERAVYAMERRGVRLLPEPFADLRGEVMRQLGEARHRLESLGFAGEPGSTQQTAEWLQSCGYKLKRTKPTKRFPKGQLSTKRDHLATLVGDEPEALIDWRIQEKRRSSFVDTLPAHAINGLIHADVRTANTGTGRLAYADPPLQQVPKRGEGKVFRGAFSGPSGGVAVCDYVQMEMCTAAGLSGDPVLLDIFASGNDLHEEVARLVGNLPASVDIPADLRVQAKAINFGILNGMRPKRLAQEMTKGSGYKKRYTYAEASRFYEGFLARFAVLADWMDETWRLAEKYHVAETEAGRVRPYVPNWRGEYESSLSAVSVRVQGTAAEIVRMAVIAVEEAGLEPILQVHDEILCDWNPTGPSKCGILGDIMEEAANSAFPALKEVKFTTDGYEGRTWGG